MMFTRNVLMSSSSSSLSMVRSMTVSGGLCRPLPPPPLLQPTARHQSTAAIAIDDLEGSAGSLPVGGRSGAITAQWPAGLAAPDYEDDDDDRWLQSETTPAAARTKSFDEIPGPRGLPLIGNVLSYSKLGPYRFEKILDNRLEYMRRYGKIYKEKLGPMWMVNIFDPTDLATMFRLEGRYPSRGKIAGLEVSYLERNNKLIGFAFRDGPEWARQRSCIQRLMMHPETAAQFLNYQMPVARDFADYLGNIRDGDQVVPDLYENLFKYTMESIANVCFGDRIGTFDPTGRTTAPSSDDARQLSAAIAETFVCFRSCMFNFPWYRYFRTPTYKRFETAANNMRQIMGKYVAAAEKRLGAKKSQDASSNLVKVSEEEDSSMCPFARAFDGRQLIEDGASMLDVLAHDPRVSSELCVNLVMALLRTGIDSTGNALAFFLHNLASNPTKQDILYSEIQKVIPDAGSTPTGETLQQMPYLKACLRESFRLHYPVFGGSGRVMPEDTIFSGYKVPKGVFIFANMAAMSRMEEYYPRPTEYHPERWLRDDRARLTTTWSTDSAFLSLPFSHGLRACPGKRFAEQGLYTAVIAILQKYRLESENTDGMGMINMPFTMPDRPLKIKFIERQTAADDKQHGQQQEQQRQYQMMMSSAQTVAASNTNGNVQHAKCPFHHRDA